jgi:hypothetical protein
MVVDKSSVFYKIAHMARQVCQMSEKAEKTGTLAGLDYVFLQSLGLSISQHIALIGAPSPASSAGTTPPASPPPRADAKRKHGSNQHSELKKAATPVPSASTKRRKKERIEGATEPVAPEPTEEPPKSCRDCGRTKTNQWRSGPEGMSTLCNACGMRYTRRLKKQGCHATSDPVCSFSPVSSRCASVLDSPIFGQESDHGLSPVSSPLPFSSHLHQPTANLLSPMLCDDTHAPQQQYRHHDHAKLAAEKRSTVYTLLN